jgi:transcriptional regulator with XRE-family HTH domain
VDPVLNNPTRFFISIEYKQWHVERIFDGGWHAWEREKRDRAGHEEPTETLLGVCPEHFLTYIRFERAAKGLSQGHRALLAEKFGIAANVSRTGLKLPRPDVSQARLHELATEFELTSDEILDLIQSAPRLKMAVRGWVAERHLLDRLRGLSELAECEPLESEGKPDLMVRLPGQSAVLLECKNILRDTYADGSYKLDFQRTRASKEDPCSRYYHPEEFQVAAACLHPRTETWEFRFALTRRLPAHDKCPGRITNRIRIGHDWYDDPVPVIRDAASTV